MIGDSVNGGLYGDYPKLDPSEQLEGDVHFNTDFRQVYSTLLEDVLGIESEPVLKQKFSTLDLVKN
jgi:uncharacterized protein (DUF1501 family)